MRAATSTLCLMTHMSWNFNPRSPCGLRPAPSDRFNDKLRTYFNPRSPCGLRLIYSPLLPLSRYFNPRSPCGLRRCFFVISSCNIGFQSPQPMRAATDSLGVCFEGDFISIPAAHAGCDCSPRFNGAREFHFNPRSPCGLRLAQECHRLEHLNFNPRSPCGLRLSCIMKCSALGLISIPAAHAGCDGLYGRWGVYFMYYFNPRSPCGLRLYVPYYGSDVGLFQSPQPMRAAT